MHRDPGAGNLPDAAADFNTERPVRVRFGFILNLPARRPLARNSGRRGGQMSASTRN